MHEHPYRIAALICGAAVCGPACAGRAVQRQSPALTPGRRRRRRRRIRGIVQSVLTGNIRPNAEAKLRLLGDHARVLDLDVGGYGSDDVRRPRLVGAAQRKASQKYGVAFGPSSTVLVGDTERDVAAALEGGALIVAVATGVTSQEELRQAGAHVVLPDLVDAPGFVAIVRDLTGRELEAV